MSLQLAKGPNSRQASRAAGRTTGEGMGFPASDVCPLALGTMAVKLDEIRSAAQRVAASHGLDVVDIEFIGPAKERTLRVYLEKNAEGRAQLKAGLDAARNEDGPTGLPERLREGRLAVEQLSGVTHEDCAAFSRDFGVLLDVEDLVPGAAYTLEASSPGLDRKLTRAADFERFVGCLVKVRTFEPIRNNRHWQGRLMGKAGLASQVLKDEGPPPHSPGPDRGDPGSGAPRETITLDLAAVKQNSKSRKAGVNTVEIAFGNIEKANWFRRFKSREQGSEGGNFPVAWFLHRNRRKERNFTERRGIRRREKEESKRYGHQRFVSKYRAPEPGKGH